MKKRFTGCIAILLTGLLWTMTMNAMTVTKTTFTYSTAPELKLDRYQTDDTAKGRPAIIFAFGGGFTHGVRDDTCYIDYFNFMARQGYVVISIDYRTSLAGFKPSGSDMMSEFGQALVGAVNDATTDFLTATGYVLANSTRWGIDRSKIIASGSSAGAITALQAEYALATARPEGFPEEFNYAAAVTFAGAILSQGAPDVGNNLCPVMMFQGDADMQVPYNKLVLGPIGLYGSDYLATTIRDGGGSGAFWTVKGAGHEMALTPMKENLYDIAGFLSHTLSGGRKGFAWTTVTVPGRGDYRTDFTIMDYIKANMQ